MTIHQPSPIGRISLVGAGPGAADLLTFRAVERMRAADVIFYDRLVDPAVLDMAGPRARRVFVGKEVGAHSWPQPRIDAAITRAALDGQQVVRLKSGDPSVFGRACEEIEAARRMGIEIEIVPGITAASAAAASLCRPLTERGLTDRLVLATATCRPGDPRPDLAELARPGTTLAFYMAMHRLDELTADMLAAGIAPGTPVSICANASQDSERHLDTTLSRMQADVTASGIANPAVILIHLPKRACAVQSVREVA